MDRWLARIERRIGFLTIPNLSSFLGLGMALAFFLSMLRPGFLGQLMLDPQKIFAGQLWRIVTCLFVPAGSDPIWVVLGIFFFWQFATSVEAVWGSFKFNAFYVMGLLLTVAVALFFRVPLSTYPLHMTVLMAFGTLFPDTELRLYFLVPVSAKWIAIADALLLIYASVFGSWPVRFSVGAALFTYAVFCSPQLRLYLSMWNQASRAAERRTEYVRASASTPPVSARPRACSICGLTDDDEDADLRVCACAECARPTVFCLAHAREHIKRKSSERPTA